MGNPVILSRRGVKFGVTHLHSALVSCWTLFKQSEACTVLNSNTPVFVLSRRELSQLTIKSRLVFFSFHFSFERGVDGIG